MKDIYKKLLKEVKQEAIKLKKYATKDELCKLNLNLLQSDSPCRCIYGQMTENCFNARATELIMLCNDRLYELDNNKPDVKDALNGEIKIVEERVKQNAYSPIEIFIDLPNNFINIDKLIKFLKYEIGNLDFEEYKGIDEMSKD